MASMSASSDTVAPLLYCKVGFNISAPLTRFCCSVSSRLFSQLQQWEIAIVRAIGASTGCVVGQILRSVGLGKPPLRQPGETASRICADERQTFRAAERLLVTAKSRPPLATSTSAPALRRLELPNPWGWNDSCESDRSSAAVRCRASRQQPKSRGLQ